MNPAVCVAEKEEGNNYLLFYHEFPLSLAKLEYFADALLDCDFRSWFFPFYEYPLHTEIPRIKQNIRLKWTDDFDVKYLEGKTAVYHDNGFMERHAVNSTDMGQMSPVVFEQARLKKENIDYLSKVIALCKEQDIEVEAVSLPQPDCVLEAYRDNFNQASLFFGEYFREKQVHYYNFNDEYYSACSHSLDQYIDYSGHMNGQAAEEFSALFREVVFQK